MTRWRNWLCIGRRDIERAAAQEHFIDLCRMLGQPTPNDADPTGDWYAFWANGRVSLMASAAAYAWLVMRVDRLHPGHPGPRHRTAFFLGGLGSLALAILSPIDALSDSLATVHMVQHMLLLMAAAPLFARAGWRRCCGCRDAPGLPLDFGGLSHRHGHLRRATEDGLIRWPTAESRDRRASVQDPFMIMRDRGVSEGGSEI